MRLGFVSCDLIILWWKIKDKGTRTSSEKDSETIRSPIYTQNFVTMRLILLDLYPLARIPQSDGSILTPR